MVPSRLAPPTPSKPMLPPFLAEVGAASLLVAASYVGLWELQIRPSLDRQAAEAGKAVLEEAHGERGAEATGGARPVGLCLSDGARQGYTSSGFASSDGRKRLERAVDAFEARGWKVGFCLFDLTTQEGLSYHADEEFYPASSIKGPYLVSLFESEVEGGDVSLDELRDLSRDLVLYSDNDAYHALLAAYGTDRLAAWAAGAGVSEGLPERVRAAFYPRLCARDLACMWQRAYRYLSSGTAGARFLADLFSRRETSAFAAALPGTVSWSKAGWYPEQDGWGSDATTSEAGVVFSDSGPYVLAVLTTAPEDFDALAELVRALDDAHDATP